MKGQSWAVRRGLNLMARLVLVGAAGAALVVGLSASPAANEALRAPGPYGDWRHVPAAAFYDAGDYFFELGYDHVLALSQGVLAQAREEESIFGDRASLLEKARILLEQALRRSPADAQAWAAFALVSAMQGDDRMRARALRRSWELAPYNPAIAGLRMMTLAAVPPTDPRPDVREAIRRDLQTMRLRRRRDLERLLQAAPRLQDLVGRLEGT